MSRLNKASSSSQSKTFVASELATAKHPTEIMAPLQQQQAEQQDSAFHLNDLVSLPIIITGFDAETQTSHKKSDDQTSQRSASTSSESSTSNASLQRWATGFNDFADEIWKNMTDAMRAKLREAAVEVLKKTDDTKSDASGQLLGEWDEDARFLD